MKKWIVLLSAALILAAAAIIYSTSTLSLDNATATFSVYEGQKGMNTLKVEAPYGYYVIRYSVVPRWPPNEQKPFKLGGRGVSNDPIGLFDDATVHASYFPSRGTVDDIPVETHVRISPELNVAATAEIPADKDILLRCGTYIIVTEDRSTFDRLESIVSKWSVTTRDAKK